MREGGTKDPYKWTLPDLPPLLIHSNPVDLIYPPKHQVLYSLSLCNLRPFLLDHPQFKMRRFDTVYR